MPVRKAVSGLVAQARGATGVARPSLVRGGPAKWVRDLVWDGKLPPAGRLATVDGMERAFIATSSIAMNAINESPDHINAFYTVEWRSPHMQAATWENFTATASGNYGTYYPWGAFHPDLVPATSKIWSVNAKYNAWITLQLPERRLVTSVEWTSINHTGPDSIGRPYSYRIEGSDDNATWTNLSGPQTTDGNYGAVKVTLNFAGALVKYVRFFCVESHANYTGIGFMEIIGKAPL